MASSIVFKRSNICNRKSLLCNDSRSFHEDITLDEASLDRKMETLSVTKRLVRSVREKFNNKKKKKKKKKRNDLGRFLMEERAIEMKPSSSRCLSIYIKGAGCNRVGACDEINVLGRKNLVNSDYCLPTKVVEKKHSRKLKEVGEMMPEFSLSDDVLEMILVRLPLRALVIARLVCKKWSRMIVSPQFMQLRLEGYGQHPWFFLFGLSRKGIHLGEVFALDVVENHWHVIRNDVLKDRFMFAVESIGKDIYIVGGCTASTTHKEVLVFSPLNNSWREVSPMKVARSKPVLGVFEVSVDCNIFNNQENPHDQNQTLVRCKARIGWVSDVYEDPHRFSLRRQLRDTANECTNPIETRRTRGRSYQSPRFALIVVGGVGIGPEPLDSGEIYDPSTNSWIDIARLPEYFGSVCSGAVCNGKFFVFSSIFNKLASYDLERGFWVIVQTSHFPPRIREYNPKLISCRKRLFMCCVCWSERDGDEIVDGREKAVRKLWELNTGVPNSWAEVCTHPDAPMDKNATFVADCDTIYGLEMFRVFGQVLDFVTSYQVSDTEMEWSRVTRKHAGHEACVVSSVAKATVMMHL